MIKNLTIKNAQITVENIGDYAKCNVGVIAGRRGLDFIIENCSVLDCVLNIKCNSGSSTVGGLVGQSIYNEKFKNCSSVCDIILDANGSNNGTIGGVVGEDVGVTTVENCFSAMTITKEDSLNIFKVGSMVGGMADEEDFEIRTVFLNSYYDSTKLTIYNFNNGTPKTTAEMKQQSTYIGWDFNSVWSIVEGVGYPKLRSEVVPDYVSKWNMAGFTDVKGVNNLNNIGGITFGTGVRGDASSAMVFSGSDSVHFSNNDIILKNDEPFTITGWVYVEDFTHPFQNILNLKTEKSYGLTIVVSSYPAYKGISINNVEDCLSGQMNNVAFVEKTWTFIAVSSSSCLSSFDLEITTNEYTKKPTELAGGFPITSNNNGFSYASSSDYGFRGKLQNFRYYKRVLTTAEKTEIYNYERLT